MSTVYVTHFYKNYVSVGIIYFSITNYGVNFYKHNQEANKVHYWYSY